MCDKCNDLDEMIGERVLALADVKGTSVKIYGTGVYEGQYVPHWVDLDLLVTTIPDEVREMAAQTVETLLEKFADPNYPSVISNTALGMGASPDRVAALLDTFFEDKEKYGGLSLEDATLAYVKDMIAKQFKTPRIRIDSGPNEGQFVYGTHCQFGKEKDMQGVIDQMVAEFAQKGTVINVETVPVPEHADI